MFPRDFLTNRIPCYGEQLVTAKREFMFKARINKTISWMKLHINTKWNKSDKADCFNGHSYQSGYKYIFSRFNLILD